MQNKEWHTDDADETDFHRSLFKDYFKGSILL